MVEVRLETSAQSAKVRVYLGQPSLALRVRLEDPCREKLDQWECLAEIRVVLIDDVRDELECGQRTRIRPGPPARLAFHDRLQIGEESLRVDPTSCAGFAHRHRAPTAEVDVPLHEKLRTPGMLEDDVCDRLFQSDHAAAG
jgi:hypothetical protein